MNVFHRVAGWRRRRRQRAIVEVLSETNSPMTTFDIAVKLGHPALVLGEDVRVLLEAGQLVPVTDHHCTPLKPGERRDMRYTLPRRRVMV